MWVMGWWWRGARFGHAAAICHLLKQLAVSKQTDGFLTSHFLLWLDTGRTPVDKPLIFVFFRSFFV
jgi:hypothetical protein